MNRLQACLFLRFIPSLGNIRSRRLWEFSDSPEDIFERSIEDFQSIDGIGTVHPEHLKGWKKHSDRVQKAEENLHKNNIKTLFLGDSDYPNTLAFCPDAPLVLFYKGNFNFAQRKCISIVGTRSGDSKGEKLCRELVAGLQEFDPIIISGFARGIDIIAHDQALKSDLTTIACMAHGLDQVYPPEHRVFSDRIEQEGGFISEFTTEEKFDRKHFLIRNRIIAGMSHATVVIQSQSEGGSMITANFAHQYHRELFAFSGEVGNSLHEGCHDLIRTQKAQLITSAEELIKGMGWQRNPEKKGGIQKKLFVELDGEEKAIFECLKDVAHESLDNIALQTQISVGKTATLLLKLEMKGCVNPLPGKFFEWV